MKSASAKIERTKNVMAKLLAMPHKPHVKNMKPKKVKPSSATKAAD
jgi:hypothetical protein